MRKVMIIFLLGIAATVFCFPAKQAEAENGQPNVLLIYHADNEEQKREVHVLDLLVGHFTNEITTVSVGEIDNIENINGFSHVFYLGVSREPLLDEEIEAIDRYEGPVFYIGNHISDFKRTSFLTRDEYKILTHIGNQRQEQKLSIGLSAIAYQAKEAVETLYEGKAGNESLPAIFKRKSDFFMATESVNGPQSHYLGESLFDFFQAEKGKPKKYLRIEDVHPNSDPEKLKAVADYLYGENIPYMIAVIPVYKNPETGKEVHMPDAREIVKVLRYMQEHGGSIVMHGYRHQL
ncbi:hypothetical protein DCC39_08175 [Pueribacillus theae]|uniref:DUF2334 domain-containing protein n=1 Tax=Pueribacillus theae TaxID=2171751 RepID=A0A2U1K3F1_9BACI|nr:DUF2334 domain-containing protein [Pueribacillus theae]PWA12046.1 hypothetical protein DCC39_08175 [Pueribacillus theae]